MENLRKGEMDIFTKEEIEKFINDATTEVIKRIKDIKKEV